jgi:hypothetical protein
MQLGQTVGVGGDDTRQDDKREKWCHYEDVTHAQSRKSMRNTEHAQHGKGNFRPENKQTKEKSKKQETRSSVEKSWAPASEMDLFQKKIKSLEIV